MPGCAKLACIYLAAGEGRRFGGGKLEAGIGGKMMGLHVAERLAGMGFGALLAISNVANTQLNPALAALGFNVLINPEPSAGQAQSLKLGLQAISSTSITGVLIALGDMPYVPAEHFTQLALAFQDVGESTAICSTHGSIRQPPAIFPQSMRDALMALKGDQGARALLGDAICVEAAPDLLRDIDTREK
jgi:molybdenum cofactor cytidylyltransferase